MASAPASTDLSQGSRLKYTASAAHALLHRGTERIFAQRHSSGKLMLCTVHTMRGVALRLKNVTRSVGCRDPIVGAKPLPLVVLDVFADLPPVQ